MIGVRRAAVVAAAILVCLPAPRAARGQEALAARAVAESRQVYVGQPFLFQIQIQGSDSPDRLDLSALRRDFVMEAAGSGADNSQQITFVNGRMERVVKEGYQLNYHLTPRRGGALTIPAITITAEGRTARTEPLTVEVKPPAEIEDFKLRLSLSRKTAYVGQPVVLTTTWYVGRSVDQFAFQMPLLDDERFQTIDPKVRIAGNRQSEYVDIPIGDGRATARKGRGRLAGWDFLTVSFDKVLVAKQAGALTIDPSVVSFRALRGSGRRRGFFDEFVFGDNFFNRGRSYENLAIPSNRLTLQVKPLPEEGRPADFSGLIGSFRFEAKASPTEVSVGDPIALRIEVSGPEYLDYVRLEGLDQQAALLHGFKVSSERPPGEPRGAAKVFTQTIRARNAAIESIPPLEFNYFDPETGRYETASTKAIPLEVRGARVVTAVDAEGDGALTEGRFGLDESEAGIAHQYEGPDALEPQTAGIFERWTAPAWLAVLLAPPAAFLGLWGWTVVGLFGANTPERRMRRARRDFETGLAALGEDAAADRLLGLVREFLGAKLARSAAALTFADVRADLERRGVGPETLAALESLFRSVDAGRYAGGAIGSESAEALREKARRTVREIAEALG